MNTQNQLIQLVENARELMNSLPGNIFIKDIESHFVECGQDFCNLTKIKKENLIGQSDYNLPWACFADSYRQHDKEAINGISSTVLELMPIDKTTILTVRALKRPILNNKGEVIGVLGQTNVLSSKDKLVKLLSAVSLIDEKNNAFSKNLPRSYDITSYNKSLKLTQRETECLFLLIRGKSAKEIAQFLSLSSRTVEEYIENIKGKMQVSSRFDLMTKAIEMGMLEIIPKNEMLSSLYKNADKWKDFF